MKCNFKQLEAAMNHFRYGSKGDNAEVEITSREESIEEGELVSCLTLTLTWKKTPESYERNIGVKTITQSIEVFAGNENRNPIVTTQESYELVKEKN